MLNIGVNRMVGGQNPSGSLRSLQFSDGFSSLQGKVLHRTLAEEVLKPAHHPIH